MKKVILKAANLIASGKEEFSCKALCAAGSFYGLTESESWDLSDKYQFFYKRYYTCSSWFSHKDINAKDIRVLLLLTFAELQG